MINEQARRRFICTLAMLVLGVMIMVTAVIVDNNSSLSERNEKDVAAISKILKTDSTRISITKIDPVSKMNNTLGQKVEYLEINNNDTINHVAFIAIHEGFIRYMPDSVYKVIK